MQKALLCVKDLSAGYRQQSVLCHLSLTVREGEFVALLGPNGCGKTTLLKTLSGVLTPSQGQITLLGHTLAKLSQKKRARLIACVPQRPILPEALTVRDFVFLGRYPHLGLFGCLSRSDYQAVTNALERTGAAAFSSRPLQELSGGELQRVLLALALAQDCPLLLLDELTASVDLPGTLDLYALLCDLCREGRTILAAMHDYNLAQAFASRLLGLKKGGILFDAPTSEAFTAQNLSQLYDVPLKILELPEENRRLAYPEKQSRPKPALSCTP